MTGPAPSRALRVAIVLTQDRGGPVDVAVALTAWFHAQPDVEVTYFGPRPAKSAEAVEAVRTEQQVGRKGDLRAMRRLRQAIRRFRPDIVHAQDRRAGLACAALARGPRHIPVVHTYHGVPDDVSEQWLRDGSGGRPSTYTIATLVADAVVARAVTRTVVVAPPMRDFLIRRLRTPRRRTVHIDNGLKLPPVRPAAAADPEPSLLFVGLLIERKGVEIALRALRTVPARLAVAGDGPDGPRLRALAADLGVADRVDFLGFRRDIDDLMRSAAVFVLPSLMEQQPLVLIEALAAGMVVVATDVGGVSDMLAPAPGNRVVAAGDVDAFATALTEVLSAPDRAKVGAANQAYARRRFDIGVCGRSHVALYREVLGR